MATDPTILLVEDSEIDRDMLIRRLTRRGYGVVVAEDGQQALDLARSSRPALILMDMMLPVLDGWEATRQLKADPLTTGIPVVGVSALAMTSDRERALSAGCDEYLTKPVDFKRLQSTIEHWLGARAHIDSSSSS